MATLETTPRPSVREPAELPRALPWHLRKRFLLPVLAVVVCGALASLVMLAAATYAYVRVGQAIGQVSEHLGALGLGGASASPASDPNQDDGDEGDSDDDSSFTTSTNTAELVASFSKSEGLLAGDGEYVAAPLARSDLIYAGSTSSGVVDVQWEDGPTGGDGGAGDLGSSFSIPMAQSGTWHEHYLSVSANVDATVQCWIRTQGGKVLAHDSASGPSAVATCTTD